MFELLNYDKQGFLGILTINRPREMNALSNALVEELDQAMDLVEADQELRVLIITGAGEKAFMAGADIKELQERDFILGRQLTKRRQSVFNKIVELKSGKKYYSLRTSQTVSLIILIE